MRLSGHTISIYNVWGVFYEVAAYGGNISYLAYKKNSNFLSLENGLTELTFGESLINKEAAVW